MVKIAYKNWRGQQEPDLLIQYAVEAALNSDWTEAVKINKHILESVQVDTEALNRLAHAYTGLGKNEKAKSIFKKVLEIDPYNLIAHKNLEKLSKTNGQINDHSQQVSGAGIFLYEPGVTKIISLLNVAPPAVLATLNSADKVEIVAKNHSVSMVTQAGTYLGALPDDLAHRLITLIGGGNRYETYIKSATPKSLTVFIREVHRSEKFTNQPSFVDSRQVYLREKGQQGLHKET